MMTRILVTVGIVLYAVVVPVLEVNDTHLFNPAWVAHARLHEAWQLVTNTLIGAFCLWRVWARDDVRLPSVLALMVTGGFMVAYVFQGAYGGSMVHADGTEKTLAGINVGVIGFGYVMVMSALVLLRGRGRIGPVPGAPVQRRTTGGDR